MRLFGPSQQQTAWACSLSNCWWEAARSLPKLSCFNTDHADSTQWTPIHAGHIHQAQETWQIRCRLGIKTKLLLHRRCCSENKKRVCVSSRISAQRPSKGYKRQMITAPWLLIFGSWRSCITELPVRGNVVWWRPAAVHLFQVDVLHSSSSASQRWRWFSG